MFTISKGPVWEPLKIFDCQIGEEREGEVTFVTRAVVTLLVRDTAQGRVKVDSLGEAGVQTVEYDLASVVLRRREDTATLIADNGSRQQFRFASPAEAKIFETILAPYLVSETGPSSDPPAAVASVTDLLGAPRSNGFAELVPSTPRARAGTALSRLRAGTAVSPDPVGDLSAAAEGSSGDVADRKKQRAMSFGALLGQVADTSEAQKKMRMRALMAIDMQINVLSIVQLLCVLASMAVNILRLEYSLVRFAPGTDPALGQGVYVNSTQSDLMAWLTIAFSAVSIVVLFLLYRLLDRNEAPFMTYPFYYVQNWKSLLTEVFVLCLVGIPGQAPEFSVIGLFRFYHIFRVLRFFPASRRMRKWQIQAGATPKQSITNNVKHLLRVSPWLAIAGMLATVLPLLAYTIWALERVYIGFDPDEGEVTLNVCFWWTSWMITVGEAYSPSVPGRLVALITGATSVLLSTILFTSLERELELDSRSEALTQMMIEEHMGQQVKVAAVNLLASWVRWRTHKRNGRDKEAEAEKRNMAHKRNVFHELREELEDIQGEDNGDVTALIHSLQGDATEIMKMMRKDVLAINKRFNDIDLSLTRMSDHTREFEDGVWQSQWGDNQKQQRELVALNQRTAEELANELRRSNAAMAEVFTNQLLQLRTEQSASLLRLQQSQEQESAALNRSLAEQTAKLQMQMHSAEEAWAKAIADLNDRQALQTRVLHEALQSTTSQTSETIHTRHTKVEALLEAERKAVEDQAQKLNQMTQESERLTRLEIERIETERKLAGEREERDRKAREAAREEREAAMEFSRQEQLRVIKEQQAFMASQLSQLVSALSGLQSGVSALSSQQAFLSKSRGLAPSSSRPNLSIPLSPLGAGGRPAVSTPDSPRASPAPETQSVLDVLVLLKADTLSNVEAGELLRQTDPNLHQSLVDMITALDVDDDGNVTATELKECYFVAEYRTLMTQFLPSPSPDWSHFYKKMQEVVVAGGDAESVPRVEFCGAVVKFWVRSKKAADGLAAETIIST